MKKYSTIITLVSVLILLTACSEAWLDELPFVKANLTVRWAGEYPEYEVTWEADDGVEVRNIDIFERFLDMNYETGKVDHHRWVGVYKPMYPCIIGNKYWPAYSKDMFKAYAKITTSIGLFYSNIVEITYPTDGIVRVGKGVVKLECSVYGYETYTHLDISGENFDMKAKYKIGGEEVKISKNASPKLLVFNDFLCKKSSIYDTTLSINDVEYPITIDFPIARIASISKTEIEIGDTIDVELKDCGRCYYDFKNCTKIRSDLDNQKYTLLPKATEAGELEITPSYNGVESYEKVVVTVKVDHNL